MDVDVRAIIDRNRSILEEYAPSVAEVRGSDEDEASTMSLVIEAIMDEEDLDWEDEGILDVITDAVYDAIFAILDMEV